MHSHTPKSGLRARRFREKRPLAALRFGTRKLFQGESFSYFPTRKRAVSFLISNSLLSLGSVSPSKSSLQTLSSWLLIFLMYSWDPWPGAAAAVFVKATQQGGMSLGQHLPVCKKPPNTSYQPNFSFYPQGN